MTNVVLDNIKKSINKYSDYLQNTYNVNNIGVFGSVSRGQQTKMSDLDILIELSQPLGIYKFLELEDFLGKILKKKVDLVTRKALKPAIKEKVLKEVIYV